MSKHEDIEFLKAALCVLLSAKDGKAALNDVAVLNAIVEYLRTDSGDLKLGELLRPCSKDLQYNFLKGYKNAISKYGPDVAKDRMADYVTTVILQNTDMTKEELMRDMFKAEVITRMIVGGYKFEKDENGEYHSMT